LHQGQVGNDDIGPKTLGALQERRTVARREDGIEHSLEQTAQALVQRLVAIA
jgi:hypothetical protein